MVGEVSIGGVYVPVLLVLAVLSLLATPCVVGLLDRLQFFRFVVFRTLVDICVFILLLGSFGFLSELFGLSVL